MALTRSASVISTLILMLLSIASFSQRSAYFTNMVMSRSISWRETEVFKGWMGASSDSDETCLAHELSANEYSLPKAGGFQESNNRHKATRQHLGDTAFGRFQFSVEKA